MHIGDTISKVAVGLADNKLLVAIIAAFIAYRLSLRAQKSTLKEQHRLSIYDAIWEPKGDLQTALTQLEAGLQSFGTECIMLRSITGANEAERNARIRDRWFAYTQRLSDSGVSESEAFSNLFRAFEKTEYAYPHLRKPFLLLRDEHQEVFLALQTEVLPFLFQVDPVGLLSEDREREVRESLEGMGVIGRLLDVTVYADDFAKLVQREIAGKLFAYRPPERKPLEGKVLTADGWKDAEKPSKKANKKR